MLAFVTSLRHPHNSTDYSHVERLLRATVASMDAQQDAPYRIFVVGNIAPTFALPAAAEFVPVDFAPPSDVSGPQTGREAVLKDKGTKLAVGLLAAARHHPTHVMCVDADDFVSRRLASLVASAPDSAGWRISTGYVYSAAREVVRKVSGFNERCGSSLLLNTGLLAPPQLPLTATQDEIVDGFGDFTVRELLGSHRRAVSHFAEQGRPLTDVPFPGAVYQVDTGENHSGSSLRLGRPVSRRLHDEFGLPASRLDVRGTVASVRDVVRAALPGRTGPTDPR